MYQCILLGFALTLTENIQAWIAIVTGALGLISAAIPLGTLLIKAVKANISAKNWKKIMEIADKAMVAAEASGAAGEDKKAQVIAAVKAGCAELGIDADSFLDQLSAYIDQCIDFANNLKDAATTEK